MTIKDIEKNISDWVTIGIATKNRWQDLQVTLEKIVGARLANVPIIIIDDCSDEPCPLDNSNFPLKLELYRFSESRGYITRRNQIAQKIKTKYYLSLDDDSFPVSGSLAKAIEFAESKNNLFCVSFPIYNPILNAYQNYSLNPEAYQVRSFIGCGHLLHLPRFYEIGGYCNELIHQGEEMEIAARAFQKGWYCYHFPNFSIHHTASDIGRNWHRMDFYGARNNLLWNDWFVPRDLMLIQQFRTMASRLWLSLRVKRLGQCQGMISAVSEVGKFKQKRSSFSRSQYSEWKKLPQS